MKKYSIIIALVLPVFLLVVIKSFTFGHFRMDAARWAESSINHSNMLTQAGLATLGGENLIIQLNDSTAFSLPEGEMLTIPAASLLDPVNRKRLRQHKGNIILVSDDPALSAKMYMLLCQMGQKNLFMLTDDMQQEAFKYKFRPDTLTWPEL